MPILPFELSLTVGVATAVFALGVIAWWHNKWTRGNAVFAFLCFTLALWTSVGWFQSLQSTALPLQVELWRSLFYLSIFLGPVFALHAAAILGNHHFRVKGWIMYCGALLLFVVIDSAILLQAYPFRSVLGERLFDFGSLFGLLFYVVATLVIGAQLYPIAYSHRTEKIFKRRSAYGLVLLSIYLLAGVFQFIQTPLPLGVPIVTLAGTFFVIASIGFIRVRFFDVDLSALEAFFVVLATSAFVVVLQARTQLQVALSLAGAVAVGVFGVMAVGSVRGASCAKADVEKLSKEIKDVEQTRNDFIAIVAHQMKGPLGGARGASDMLLRGDYGKLSEDAKQVVGQMKNSMDRLLSLSDTALHAARIEAGAFQTVQTETDVVAELGTLIAEVEPFAKAKGLELTSSFTGIPPHLNIDREILRNVVFNLIDNAIKFTDHGHVAVVGIMRGGRLIISVSDTGSGLSLEDIKHLFQRFHKGRAGKEHGHDGAGLGLYVVKQLTTLAGGKVSVRSDGLKKGTTFTLEFPV
jgi:signal transduction histidine kinase